MKIVEDLEDFANMLNDALVSDRDVIIGFAGMTGEGKSTCMIQLAKAFCKIRGTKFDMNCMTWDRAELLRWVDGDKDGKGRLPEYSVLMPDELISMFYKRNWYEDEQKSAVELFNKCRDRHLLIEGAVPNFWDLDSGMLSRFRYYVYIPARGIAWVFKQENNPFAGDQWNVLENRKVFRKKRGPYNCPNFAFEFLYKDLSSSEKRAYLKIRNEKRRNTELQNKKKDVVKYGKIKRQRDEALRMVYDTGNYTHEDIGKRVELSRTLVTDIINGVA